MHEADEYVIRGGILYHRGGLKNKIIKKNRERDEQIAIPIDLRRAVLESYHDNFGHAGFDRTYGTVRLKYHWLNLYFNVKEYCRTCLICQQINHDSKFRPAPLNPWPITEAWGEVGMQTWPAQSLPRPKALNISSCS